MHSNIRLRPRFAGVVGAVAALAATSAMAGAAPPYRELLTQSGALAPPIAESQAAYDRAEGLGRSQDLTVIAGG